MGQDRIVVIGAGMGGLATAIRLAAAGREVRVIEALGAPGGKMRTLPSTAGPVDAGPTVLTMRHVFDDLFAAAGTRLDEHVTLQRESLLARHFWTDGSVLDLWDDPERSAEAVRAWGGARAEADFRAFSARARRLFEAFDAPMMQTAAPSFGTLAAHVLRHPRLIADMGLGSLATALRGQFREPRLRQLFGRYATYVGGSPYRSPAVLGLIWHAEASGVWRVKGGMHKLAEAMAGLAESLGADIACGTRASHIEVQGGRTAAVVTEAGERIACSHVVHAGDPKALHAGLLGPAPAQAVPKRAVAPRSLSAHVLAFAAVPQGADLAYHNVFFGDDPRAEFGPIERGAMPEDPTIYVCAEDRGGGAPAPGTLERFETIMNAPPTGAQDQSDEEIETCLTRTWARLARSGLTFSHRPTRDALTTQAGFHRLFPASDGSLYGRSPHGMLAAFSRPTATTALPGLILAGGGAHPGAGIPMATLSGRHAAAAILSDRTSISMSPGTATPGGISTASPTTAAALSRSSPSSAPSSRPGTAGRGARTPPTTAA
ncbi:MAG: 1-hydroxycarotenoid 3,4-desaturase CrtD [Rhodobacteraceae bacterium HLUCCA09]|nr:MAG: 1-hydroxycarotenoid 3,4-desaturase CrtD [Rhodobacteraceae bacterium HLUCCA09]